jgi:hypothetical protein
LATYTKINSFVENLAEKLIDLSGAGLTIALTNTAHTATWDELADLTQIAYTNLSSRILTVASSEQTSGTYKLIVNDLTLTSTGGATGPFRYIYVYDDSSTGDKLIGYFDYGSSITLNDGESLNLNFDGSNGLLTIA